ncbi:MAG: HigA family addiction module antitoxin [Bryobacterales bacterium]|nr:HigA family addiction module antitoxin [Bryobacterales bacterium]
MKSRLAGCKACDALGELIRESMDDVRWNVTETAARVGCERGTLSRLVNGKAGVSANMALALEDIGWGTADHWMRMQASYTSLRRCAGSGPPPNGAHAHCTRDPTPRHRHAVRETVAAGVLAPFPANGAFSPRGTSGTD